MEAFFSTSGPVCFAAVTRFFLHTLKKLLHVNRFCYIDRMRGFHLFKVDRTALEAAVIFCKYQPADG
jgi:hypothetical protein